MLIRGLCIVTAIMLRYGLLCAALGSALQPPLSKTRTTRRGASMYEQFIDKVDMSDAPAWPPAVSTQPADLCARLLEQVDRCNDLGDGVALLPLVVDDRKVGELRPDLAAAVANAGDAFRIDGGVVRLNAALEAAAEPARTEAVAVCIKQLAADGVVTGWRDELLPVVASYSAPPAFRVERAAYPLLGAKGYGVHVNGYTLDTGELQVWVATRASTKATYPGMLDHVAAGQLADVGGAPGAQVLAELAEEAGVGPELGTRAMPASVVSYRGVAGEGKGERVTNEVLFCYDIELPGAFVPRPVDGEVEGFELKSVDAVLADLVQGRFKPNVAVVTVDFLVRRGFLTPEMEGYLDLVAALRSGDCS